MLAGNPAPEGGAVTQAFAVDANGTAAMFDYALADGEAQSGALYELVELDKAVEDLCLLLLRNAGTRVLAVDVEALRGARGKGRGARGE